MHLTYGVDVEGVTRALGIPAEVSRIPLGTACGLFARVFDFAYRMFNPNFMSVEVALQYIDRARTVGEGNIGVRPQQIEGRVGRSQLPVCAEN
jgi:hypothetical protein